MKRISRRAALGAAGAGLGSMWLSGLRGAHAQDVMPAAKQPKLLFLYSEAGWVSRHFDMRPPWAAPEWSNYSMYNPAYWGEPDDFEWEFDLNDSRLTEDDFTPILKPLYRHRDVMTVLEGPSMWTTRLDPYGDGHAKAHIHAWSGVPASSSEDGTRSRGSAPSVDQLINAFIQQTQPDHQSMDFRFWEGELFHEWLYRSDGAGGAARLPVILNPQDAYTRFFGGSTEGDPLTSNASYSLSLAMRQFDEIAPRLPASDRAKLEAHREMLSGVERKLGRRISCDGSTRPPTAAGQVGASIEERYVADIEAYAQMVAAGFACGITRVASIGPITAPNATYGLDPAASIHHEFEHPIDPPLFYAEGGPSAELLDKEQWMVKRNARQMETVASIIDILRGVPDGDGTLLDTTLVVYMSELAHGNHGHEHYPTVMFGNANNMLTPGRYVKYAQNYKIPFDRNYANQYTGPAHSQLLTAICQSFGLPTEFLGAASMQVQGGAEIDISGPLPRLRVS